MLFEHWIYSAAIALIVGTIYHRSYGRDLSWIIVASAYAPDIDIISDQLLRKMGILILVHGYPIVHGDFHNIAVLISYAVLAAFLLNPIGIKFMDSFFFASIGFAAHLFEDALVFNPGYAFLWPLTPKILGIGLFHYTPNLLGIADQDVLIVGLIFLGSSAILKIAYEGTNWIERVTRYLY